MAQESCHCQQILASLRNTNCKFLCSTYLSNPHHVRFSKAVIKSNPIFIYLFTSCKRSVTRRARKKTVVTMHYQNNKHVKIFYYIFLSMILVEQAQYNSCCFFVVKRSKNYNAVVSRQNIRIRFLLFSLFDVNFFCFVLFLRDKFRCFYHFL